MKNGISRFGQCIVLLALAAVMALGASGCSWWGKKSTKPDAGKSSPPPASESRTNLVIAPTIGPIGKVASVNGQARFAVLNFPVGQVPRKDTTVGVYRAGMKVGEIKITGPEQETLTVGDIVAGSAEIGDEVRVE